MTEYQAELSTLAPRTARAAAVLLVSAPTTFSLSDADNDAQIGHQNDFYNSPL